MKKMKNKIAAIAIAIFLMLSMTASMKLIPTASAQGSVLTVPTFAYLACSPNPIGVNQQLLVNTWVTPPTDWSGVVRTGYIVKITAPNGTVITVGPRKTPNSDSTDWFHFVPDAVGNWTLQLTYGGDYYPVGTPYVSNVAPFPSGLKTTYAVNYTGSVSPITTLDVTTTQVPGYTPTALPTAYWSRPVSLENREWSQLLGDWVMTGADSGLDHYQRYGGAPNTAHILWVDQNNIGGIVGGAYQGATYSGEISTNEIVYPNGTIAPVTLYYHVTTAISEAIGGLGFYFDTTGTHCIDLRTGQELWVNPVITTITCVKNEEWIVEGGGTPIDSFNAYVMYIGAYFAKWDAYTGQMVCNVTGMTGTYDCPYVYSVQTKGTQNYLIKWTTDGISSNFTSRIMYNVTYPLNGITGIYDSPNAAGAVNGVGVLPGSNSVGFYFGNTVAGTSDYATMYTSGAFNCATGQMLWMQNYTYAMQTFSPSCGEIASPGVYTNALYAGDPNQNGMRPLIGIDIYTGNILFNNTVTSYPWGSFWSYSMAGAYGMVYYPTYTGYVYAFNDTTGAIVWKGGYNYAGYETPYGYQPFFAAILVGGGYVYAGNGEHSEGPPYYQGKQLWCLNATTGATVWSIPFWLQTQQCYAIIADGLLIATNYYDDRQYCFGMGPSATTVTAPDIGVTTSTPVTITGTVTDISTGATQKVVAANFPHGLPCVSDASQSAWMSYVYMQKPMPTNVTGVPVTISVLDSNGNYRQIGQTTSDTSGTFAFTWTPDIPGSYTVIATFAGTQSYYGSNAETHFYASAPAPTASPYPQVSLSATGTAIGEAAAAIIIAIAIGFAITILMLRKRP